jgi:hypothetical protein
MHVQARKIFISSCCNPANQLASCIQPKSKPDMVMKSYPQRKFLTWERYVDRAQTDYLWVASSRCRISIQSILYIHLPTRKNRPHPAVPGQIFCQSPRIPPNHPASFQLC